MPPEDRGDSSLLSLFERWHVGLSDQGANEYVIRPLRSPKMGVYWHEHGLLMEQGERQLAHAC